MSVLKSHQLIFRTKMKIHVILKVSPADVDDISDMNFSKLDMSSRHDPI